ncbi:MAG: hypothetical protein KJ574_02185 [Nanoarchaeota archaeon]|nr:hypothetical protein [Nanoarchaeota archaeon]
MRKLMGTQNKISGNKKAVFYTLIAVTLLLAIVFASSLGYQFKYREQRAIVETRVNTMDEFLNDLGYDMEKGVRIAGYRSILGMTNYVVDSIAFLDDTEQRFQELFYYGTIYGNYSAAMEDNTFLNWTQKMSEQAERMGLDVTFALVSFNVEHSSPWEIQISVNVSVIATEMRDVATWRKEYYVQSTIPIYGFEDPAYAVKTGSGVVKRINQTIYDWNYVSGNDTTNLEKHMNFTYYTAFDGSPTFLMRFEGDFNGSEYGIESLVNKAEVGPYYPCSTGTSNVDSLYWQCSTAQTWDVAGMPSWFYLDNQTGTSQSRHQKYEVSGLI